MELDRYVRLVAVIRANFSSDEEVKTALADEAARLGLTPDAMLRPEKTRHLLESRQSPVLEAALEYFADQQHS